MKANGEKRKIFNDAVDLLNGAEDTSAPEGGIQMLPIESIRPFRKHPFRLYEGERRMFHEEDVQMLDKSYFNIVMMGDYDVTIQSKNTGHLWYIHNSGYPSGDTCIIFHKHKASHPYHQHGKARNLRQAVNKIKGHDMFQMNGRK